MQLPRGTFREIRKSVAIESLLKELDGEKFSGVANISSPSLNGTLVIKTGKCILVKFQNSRGDAAWEELQKTAGEEVDAALSLLGDAQIELALEFNKPCRLVRPAKQQAAAARRPAPSAANEPPRSVQAQKTVAPAAPLKPPLKPAPAHHPVSAPPASPQAPAPAHVPPPHVPMYTKSTVPASPLPQMPAIRHEDTKTAETEEPPRKEHDTSNIVDDLDTFDTMDIDTVTDKIRTDCKTMIKQLHLDHLMER